MRELQKWTGLSEIIRQVESILEEAESVLSVDLLEVGGVNYIAEIMNKIDRSTERYFTNWGKEMPSYEEIRSACLYRDIVTLIPSPYRVPPGSDTRVCNALKYANKEVSAIIFENMSQRMGETVRSEMEYPHNVRQRRG